MANKNYVGKTALTQFLSNLRNVFSPIGHEHTSADISDWKSATVEDDNEGNVVINFGQVTSIQGSQTKKGIVTMNASSWVKEEEDNVYSQVVAIDEVTSTSIIDLQPDISELAQLSNDKVAFLKIDNVDGICVAVAIGGCPTADLTIQCTITEVE